MREISYKAKKKILWFRQKSAKKEKEMQRLEISFPPFDTIVCDPELEKYFAYGEKVEPEKINIIGYAVIVRKWMPSNSAVFLHGRNVVAIYLDGKVAFDKIKTKVMEVTFADFLKGKMKEGE